MKKKSFTYGITFFVKPSMYDDLKKVSDDLGIGMSDLLRGMIEEYLVKNLNSKMETQTDGLL